MSEPFAQVEDVQGRIDFTMSAAEERVAGAALDDMSEEARYHAGQAWPVPEEAPRMVRRLVLVAVARYMKNLDGLTQSRAGDETVAFTDLGDKAGAPFFSDAEIETLRRLGGAAQGGFVSAEVTAYRTDLRRYKHHQCTLVNTDGDPFPLNEECWGFGCDCSTWHPSGGCRSGYGYGYSTWHPRRGC
ncbi:hypothetical protein [Salinispora tropica]|uniref:Head-to-tail adaptor n=1 Tax=Salinispora tropica (strain ATCC BAA-916 / DSM 44818 / JCM 13857 / NBRC 105044 / CNB-440) TaxID=369723 RepID=A4X2C3_SALTO|nr:hypothetical protein [Salinispora tropica]ABP53023.1 hypothetical protein Strop_0540 [Salinispora tropica CNB-440]